MVPLSPKVLLVLPWFYGFERSIPRAFVQCGCDVDAHVYFPHDTLAEKVRNRLVGEVTPQIGLDVIRRRRDLAFNRRVIDAARRLQPELVVVIKGEILAPETVESLGRVSRLLYWAIDEPERFSNVVGSLGCYEAAVAFSREAEAFLAARVPEVRFLLNGYDESVFRRLAPAGTRYRADVSFVGARYPIREEALLALAADGARLSIWGGDWRRMPWRARFYEPRTPLDRYAFGKADLPASNVIYNDTKVNLNVHGTWGGLNTRVFEIPGAGAFQLCDAREGLAEVLTPDREVAVYHDLDELREKASFYLRNDSARLAIAAAGEARVSAAHTWARRVDGLLRFLGVRQGHPKAPLSADCRVGRP